MHPDDYNTSWTEVALAADAASQQADTMARDAYLTAVRVAEFRTRLADHRYAVLKRDAAARELTGAPELYYYAGMSVVGARNHAAVLRAVAFETGRTAYLAQHIMALREQSDLRGDVV